MALTETLPLSEETVRGTFRKNYQRNGYPDYRSDAHAMAALLSANGTRVDPGPIHNAILYGIDNKPYVDTESVLFDFAQKGDATVIWTQGDPMAQFYKVRKLGWEESLRNPKDKGSFVVMASHGKRDKEGQLSLKKHDHLPTVIDYARKRDCETVFVVDDTVSNLIQAKELLDERYQDPKTKPQVLYVWMNRKGKVEELPEYVAPVTSMVEYQQLVEQQRSLGKITHVLDLDWTLINTDNSRPSREEAVVNTVVYGQEYKKPEKQRAHPFNGIFVYDSSDHFRRMTGGVSFSPDFAGHQATIHAANGSLVKQYATDTAHRPLTSQWQEVGGYHGAKALAQTMGEYRQRLREAGLSVPKDARFLVGKDRETGNFFPLEVVSRLADSNLQDELWIADLETRKRIIGEILDASLPILTTDGIGADLKPANWVRSQEGLVHIDPLPVIMRDNQTGLVLTEWPVIENPHIQNFLYETHLTPKALGFRFYQELCQIDPGNRSFYDRVIGEKLSSWTKQGYISESVVREVAEAMQPASSQIFERMLSGFYPVDQASAEIQDYYNQVARPGSHPIYMLRELGFAVSEKILQEGTDPRPLYTMAFFEIQNRMGEQEAQKIMQAVEAVPSELGFLTVIRKLTHLSSRDAQAGIGEETALRILLRVPHVLLEPI